MEEHEKWEIMRLILILHKFVKFEKCVDYSQGQEKSN